MSAGNAQSSGFQIPSRGFPLQDVVPEAKQAAAATRELGKVMTDLRASAGQLGTRIVRSLRQGTVNLRTLATSGLKQAEAGFITLERKAGTALLSAARAAGAATPQVRQLKKQSDKLRRAWERMRLATRIFSQIGRGLARLKVAGGGIKDFFATKFQISDSLILLQARLGATTGTASQAQALFAELSKRAQAARAPIQEFADAFLAMRQALAPFPALAGQAGKLTELFAKSARLSGAAGAEATARVQELAQTFADGSISVGELNEIIDTLPDAATRVAVSLGTMGVTASGTVEEMRKLAEEGQLSAATFLDAFLQAGAGLEKDFAQAPLTVGDALTVLKDKLATAIAEQDRGRGITSKLAKALVNFSNVIPQIAPALGAVADALAGLLLEASKHPAVFTAVASAFLAVKSGVLPLLQLFGGTLKDGFDLITGGASKLATFLRGGLSAGLKLVRSGLISLRGALLSTGIGVVIVLAGVLLSKFLTLVKGAGSVSNAFALLGNVAKEIWQRIALGAQLMGKLLSVAWNETLAFLFGGLDKGLRAAMKFGRVFMAVFQGAFAAVKTIWKNLPAVIGDLVIQGANFVISAIEGMVNKGIGILNSVLAFANKFAAKLGLGIEIDPIPMLDIPRIENKFKDAAKKTLKTAKEELTKPVEQALKQETGPTELAQSAQKAAAAAQEARQEAGKLSKEIQKPMKSLKKIGDAMKKGQETAEETTAKACEAAEKLRQQTDTANAAAEQAGTQSDKAGERAKMAGENAAAGLRQTCEEIANVGKKAGTAGQQTEEAMRGAAQGAHEAKQEVESLGQSMQKVSKQAQDLAKSIGDSLRSSFEGAVKTLLDGSLKGFKSFGKKLSDAVRSALAKALTARFIEPFIKQAVDDLARAFDALVQDQKTKKDANRSAPGQPGSQETTKTLTQTLGETRDAIVDLKKGCMESKGPDVTAVPGQQKPKQDDKKEDKSKESSFLGKLIGGAIRGLAVAGLPGLFGAKTSRAGGAAGGALGQLLGGKLGSIIGGLVGSLIGGAFKKTPQASVSLVGGQRNTPFTRGGGQAETADRLQSAVLDALDRIAADLGGIVTTMAFGVIGQRGKKFFFNPTVTTPDKRSGKPRFGAQIFATGEGATLAAIKEAIRDGVIVGLSETAKTIAANSRATTPDQFLADLQFARIFDELTQLGKPTSSFVKKIKDLNRQFAQAIVRAHSLGLAEGALAKARERALKQIADDFNRSVEFAILEITDPIRAALEKQKDKDRQFLLDAVAAGADIEQALRKVRLNRQKLIDELEQNANAAIEAFKKSIRNFIDELRFGDRSRLAERERLPILFARFRQLAERAKTDEEARNQLQELADKILKSGEAIFASSADFFKLQDQVIAILEDVTNNIETVDIQKIADEVGRIELDPEFQRLMADIGQEIASSNEQVIDLLAQIRDRLPGNGAPQTGQPVFGGGSTPATAVGGGGVGFVGGGDFRRVQVA